MPRLASASISSKKLTTVKLKIKSQAVEHAVGVDFSPYPI